MYSKKIDVLFVARGRPGLGHVTPSVAVAQHLSSEIKSAFVSYDSGSKFLKTANLNLFNIDGPPLGQRLSPFFDFIECKEIIWPIINKIKPKVVVVDGEYYLPSICKQNDIKIVILASQHYIEGKIGEYKRYSDIIKILFKPADKIFVHGIIEPERFLVNADFVGPVVCKYRKQKEEDMIVVTSGGGDMEHRKIVNKNAFDIIKNIKNIRFEFFSGPNGIFAKNLLEWFSRSKAVIARAGLVTLEELFVLGKPSILLAPSNDSEKMANAEMGQKIGLGIKLIEDSLNEKILHDSIDTVLKMKSNPIKSHGAKAIAENIEDML